MKTIIDKAERLLKIPQPSLGTMKLAHKRLAARGVEVIDLSRVVPYSDVIRRFLDEGRSRDRQSAGEMASQDQILRLQTQIARKHVALRSARLDPEKEMILTPGIRATMAYLSLAFLNPGDAAAFPDPGYRYLRSAICLADAYPSAYRLADKNDYVANIPALTRPPQKRLKALFLNYPHNPTGAEVDHYFFRDLLKSIKLENILIIQDCAYVHPGDGEVSSVLQIPGARKKALELHSFSTTFGLGGLGFATGHRDVISILKSVLDIMGFVPDSLTIGSASVMLDHAGEIFPEYGQALARGRETASAKLKELGWRVRAGKRVPFIWTRPPAWSSSLALARRILIKAGVKLSPGSDFGEEGEGWLRMVLHPDRNVMEKALERIAHHSRIWQRRYRASS
jgi:aspartate/methionine/tyrosine aminotransferase